MQNSPVSPTIIRGTAITGLLLVVTGIAFKILHFPGANSMIITGYATAALFFIFDIFNREAGRNVSSVILNLAMTSLLLGSMFKFMHWPGGAMLLIIYLMLAYIFILVKLMLLKPTDPYKSPARWMSMAFYFSLLFLFTGSFFSFTMWPGVELQMAIAILTLPVIVYTGKKMFLSPSTVTVFNFRMTVIVLTFALQHLVSSVLLRGTPRFVLGNSVSMHNEINRSIDRELEIGSLYLNSLPDSLRSKAEMIDHETEKVIGFMSDIQLELLKACKEDTGRDAGLVLNKKNNSTPLRPLMIKPSYLMIKDDYLSATRLFIKENGLEATSTGERLWASYGTLRGHYMSVITGLKDIHMKEDPDAGALKDRLANLFREKGIREQQIAELCQLYIKLNKPEVVSDNHFEGDQTPWIVEQFNYMTIGNSHLQLSKMQLEVLEARTMALRILGGK